ncbi:hypothetical protein HanIR_Chr08g0354951 [Helianthus annuus]|nr:hypothetical protein HanIR_Chr08g0354951 [Helianthus annuus]
MAVVPYSDASQGHFTSRSGFQHSCYSFVSIWLRLKCWLLMATVELRTEG